LKLHVEDEVLEKRELQLSPASPTFGTGRELFEGFRNIVSSADLGASAFGIEE
jgi:phosphogluconate dehydratase